MSRGGDWVHPPTRLAIVWFRDAGRCLACGWRPAERFGAGLVLDHLIPTSRWGGGLRIFDARGPHDPKNLATLCEACHASKGDRFPWDVFEPHLWRRLSRRGFTHPLTRWHRRRGYLAAVRLGRYRAAYNAEKCRARRRERAYLRREREAIRASGGG